ncbi:Protein N-acetyltransferase, RimJ/RimL family [Dyella jiangningensis]|uniref:GNAT family N-acetyltransferase n=1 Tax=Dyella sp. AtDHG13 TaxID=1938897 RepID=UPI00088D9A61|nr:GNAT family N-acetyltransferase [Dyella sp. AtDHG13]PXV52316.1 RimJ/RimL family protein N-acetyltransferase [Dyella sp. AtDHG13]SDK15264.1 Protein N-acetyltransferase, RimJ/RimL family [Dyella jiangningensis]
MDGATVDTSVVPVVETARLRLRAHGVADHAECLAIWSDPEVTRYIGGRPSTSEEVWRRLLQYAGLWSLLGYGYWAVEEKSTGRYIGDIGFADFRREMEPSLHGMLEFGWVLAPHAHGKGYASEAVAAAIAWGEQHFGDRRAVCIISPENLPSIRVAEKAGFRRWQDTTYHGSPTIVFSR